MTILGKATPESIAHFAPDGSYKSTITNCTTRIETETDVVVFSERFIGPGLLKLIVMTRAEVKRNYVADQIIQCQAAPEYSQLGNFEKKSAAVEVDISKAYLTAALKIGAISKFTHDRLHGCAKQTRLMVLGSLATRKVVSQYEDGKRVSQEHVQDQECAQVWRWIVAEVDQTMRQVAKELKKGFLYYWFDAAFVTTGSVKQAEQAMAERGYGSKKTMVKIHKDGKFVYVLNDGRERKFPITEKRA